MRRGGAGWGGSKKSKPIPAPPCGAALKSCPIPAPPPLWGGENPHGAGKNCQPRNSSKSLASLAMRWQHCSGNCSLSGTLTSMVTSCKNHVKGERKNYGESVKKMLIQ